MATAAELTSELARMKAIRRSLVSRVRTREHETEFRSDAEIKAAIEDIERELTSRRRTMVVHARLRSE